MKKSDRINHQGAFYERVPSLMLEMIARLNTTLAKHRQNGNSSGSLDLYEDVLNTMQLAYLYTQKTRWIHERNTILEANIRYLAHHNKQLQERLNEYETIARLKHENRLSDMAKVSE